MAVVDIAELIASLAEERFWGSLEAKFENGAVVLVKKTETLKPENGILRGNRGVRNERQ